MSGEASPDGNGTFGSATHHATFYKPQINEAGQVAFMAQMVGTSGGPVDDLGLFLIDGAQLKLAARKGDAVPESNGQYERFGFSTSTFFPADFTLNTNGEIAFGASLSTTDGGATDNQGAYFWDGESLAPIARKGQAAPGGDGIISDLQAPLFNDAGQSVILTDITDSSSSSSDGMAIFRGESGILRQIARSGQAAPDGNGTLSTLSTPVLDNAGNVVFTARHLDTISTPNDQLAIYRGGHEVGLTQIVRGGQSAPGGSENFENVTRPVVNDLGQTAFIAGYPNNMVGHFSDNRLILNDGTTNTEIARSQQIFLGPAGSVRFYSFGKTVFNNAGEIGFSATLDSPTALAGIFKGDETGLTTVAIDGQSVPEGNGAFRFFGGFDFNDNGQAVFQASLRDTFPSNVNDRGIYFYDDDLGQVTIAREGDPFMGSTLALSDNSHVSLNNQGQVTFAFQLADGREGIALWSLKAGVPEPYTAILAILAIPVVISRRSRLLLN
nr:choice-of-anchor tandem repeat NxxGxxAF-containing protein [Adhaeretor mobilis]